MKDIRHMGICVDNLERGNFFYQNLLGLKYICSAREESEFIQDLLGLETLTWVKLATDNGDLLELYWLPNKCVDSLNHVSFTVDNLLRIRNKLIEYEIKCSPIKLTKSGLHKVMFCRDWDGNLLELVEEI